MSEDSQIDDKEIHGKILEIVTELGDGNDVNEEEVKQRLYSALPAPLLALKTIKYVNAVFVGQDVTIKTFVFGNVDFKGTCNADNWGGSSSGWLIVHGDPSSESSCMAAQSVRQVLVANGKATQNGEEKWNLQ